MNKEENNFNNNYDEFFVDEQKLSECKYELLFSISASLLEENEGQLSNSQNIYAQNYHIPIPNDKDHKIFLNTFFKFLENSLSASASEAYQIQKTEDKNE